MQITEFPLVDLILLSKKQNKIFKMENKKFCVIALNFKIEILPSGLSKLKINYQRFLYNIVLSLGEGCGNQDYECDTIDQGGEVILI